MELSKSNIILENNSLLKKCQRFVTVHVFLLIIC